MNPEATIEDVEQDEDPYAGAADTLRETAQQNSQIEAYTAKENFRLQGNKLKELASFKKNRGGPAEHIPWLTLCLMLLVAIFVDIISILINALPIIGGVLEALIYTPICIFAFWLWGLISGVSLFKGLRKFVTPLVAVIGFLPVINAIPEWTFEVIMLMVISVAEVRLAKVIGKLPIPGGIKRGISKKLS